MSDRHDELATASGTAPRRRLIEVLAQDVTPQVEQRARQLIAEGDALLTKSGKGAVSGFILDGDHHETRLELTTSDLIAICQCEQRASGFICAHVWATVLLADRSGFFRPVEESQAHPLLNRNGDDAVKKKSANSWPTKPGWKIHLASIAQASPAQPTITAHFSTARPHQILYVIDAAETKKADGHLVVELMTRHQKKSGMFSKGSPLRLDPMQVEALPDATDREILARVIGAQLDRPAPAATQANPQNAAPTPEPVGIRRFTLHGKAGSELLHTICKTGRARFRTADPGRDLRPLQFDEGEAWSIIVQAELHEQGKHYVLSAHLKRGEQERAVSDALLFAEPDLVFFERQVARIKLHPGLEWLKLLETRGAVHVPCNDASDFLRQLAELPALPELLLPEELTFERKQVQPRPRLTIRKPTYANAARLDDFLYADIHFDYGVTHIWSFAPSAGIYDATTRTMILRDRAAEASAMALAQSLGLRQQHDEESHQPLLQVPARLLPRVVPNLIKLGWQVAAEGNVYRAPSDVRLSVSSGIDWFDLKATVAYGDQVIPLPKLLAAARKGEQLIKLADGSLGILPEEWLSKYGFIASAGNAIDGETLRFGKSQAGLLDVLLESQPAANIDATFQKVREEIARFGGVTPVDAPPGFTGQLRPYQRDGLGWFDFLRQFSFGGCLADDMGLGKTIQVLALLESRRVLKLGNGKNGHRVPSLVVAPRSLVFNWLQEATKFTPELKVLDHTGAARARNTERFGDYDVVLTTYGTLRSDIMFLRDFVFDYAILDEAQAVKNAATESAKAVRLVHAKHRLALSGTPVQNHLGELWSLFEFLNPGMLGAATAFDARFDAVRPTTTAPASNGDAATDDDDDREDPRVTLARALRPFILRRTKEQVASDLPPCTEQTIYCQLDEAQRTLYEELREHYRTNLMSTVASQGIARSKIQILEALLRLRQAACHPGLIDKTRIGDSSAKLDMLVDQLDEILQEGHKALVFSQFTSLLAIVRRRLDAAGTRYAYLDGKTRDRKTPVDQFQSDPDTKLFLISLKAGGLGLNLTGADYVFLLDPWWNPAVEAQAIDRAHRIGQTRHVFAYRLIAKDTVEEKVLELQKSKRDLADAILTENNAVLGNLTADDLAVLLS